MIALQASHCTTHPFPQIKHKPVILMAQSRRHSSSKNNFQMNLIMQSHKTGETFTQHYVSWGMMAL